MRVNETHLFLIMLIALYLPHFIYSCQQSDQLPGCCLPRTQHSSYDLLNTGTEQRSPTEPIVPITDYKYLYKFALEMQNIVGKRREVDSLFMTDKETCRQYEKVCCIVLNRHYLHYKLSYFKIKDILCHAASWFNYIDFVSHAALTTKRFQVSPNSERCECILRDKESIKKLFSQMFASMEVISITNPVLVDKVTVSQQYKDLVLFNFIHKLDNYADQLVLSYDEYNDGLSIIADLQEEIKRLS